MTSHDREIDRIRHAYEEYETSADVLRRWSEDQPGNGAIIRERSRAIEHTLRSHGRWPPDRLRVLDIGCGSGALLAQFRTWGARPENLVGIDLMPHNVEKAKVREPQIRFLCGDAASAPLEPRSFDLVCVFTVFSSILDDVVARELATTIDELLESGGAVLWYDFRVGNPRNPAVRGMPKPAVTALFPRYEPRLRTVTLLPPLARRLGRLTALAYPVLGAIPPLRTHYLGLLVKPAAPLLPE